MKICDLHNDIITAKSFSNAIKYLQKKSKNIEKIVLAVWTTHSKINNYFDIQSIINRFETANLNSRILFGIEDISAIDEKDYENISKLNLFYASLTWNYDNVLGGGAYGEKGLTNQGKTVLKIFEQNNIVLDTAHLNKRTFWDCYDNFNGHIICSHACFDAVRKHVRNLDDDQINAIISKNGVIGLALVGEFLTENYKAKIQDAARHIDYFVQKFGDSNLCLGTDFFGTENLPENINDYTDLYLLVEYLEKIGYNKNAIEKIFYKNFVNFLEFINGNV